MVVTPPATARSRAGSCGQNECSARRPAPMGSVISFPSVVARRLGHRVDAHVRVRIDDPGRDELPVRVDHDGPLLGGRPVALADGGDGAVLHQHEARGVALPGRRHHGRVLHEHRGTVRERPASRSPPVRAHSGAAKGSAGTDEPGAARRAGGGAGGTQAANEAKQASAVAAEPVRMEGRRMRGRASYAPSAPVYRRIKRAERPAQRLGCADCSACRLVAGMSLPCVVGSLRSCSTNCTPSSGAPCGAVTPPAACWKACDGGAAATGGGWGWMRSRRRPGRGRRPRREGKTCRRVGHVHTPLYRRITSFLPLAQARWWRIQLSMDGVERSAPLLRGAQAPGTPGELFCVPTRVSVAGTGLHVGTIFQVLGSAPGPSLPAR